MTTPLQEIPDDRGIAERAAEWLGVLETAGPEEKTAFAAWLKESPRHVEEFLCVTALNREFTGFQPGPAIADLDVQPDVVPLGAQQTGNAVRLDVHASRTTRRPWAFGIAATLAVVAGAWLAAGPLSGWKTYTAAVGEQRAFELPDGSLIHLNTRSKVKVRLSATAREVQLVSGEALFNVARDADKPFTVDAGNTLVRVLGTEFNVYRRTHETRVAVIEGKVSADAVRQSKQHVLQAGQEARIAADGHLISVTAVDTAAIAAWRQRRLVFQTERLEDIAAEFNRYNQTVRIRIEGAEVRERRLTGVFDAADPESLVQFLTKDSDLQYEARPGELVIRAR